MQMNIDKVKNMYINANTYTYVNKYVHRRTHPPLGTHVPPTLSLKNLQIPGVAAPADGPLGRLRQVLGSPQQLPGGEDEPRALRLRSYKPLEPRAEGFLKGNSRVPFKGFGVISGRFKVVMIITASRA